MTRMCEVGTGGCLYGLFVLFRCVSLCNDYVPGGAGYVDASHWRIDAQCPDLG